MGLSVKFLDSDNTYHKLSAVLLLANLTRVDKDNKFEKIFNRYYGLLDDRSFISKLGIDNSHFFEGSLGMKKGLFFLFFLFIPSVLAVVDTLIFENCPKLGIECPEDAEDFPMEFVYRYYSEDTDKMVDILRSDFNSVIVAVNNDAHWMPVIGYSESKGFKVYDPYWNDIIYVFDRYWNISGFAEFTKQK